jgi:outer membrane protein OmpA-like peptidoglycan-associated protein
MLAAVASAGAAPAGAAAAEVDPGAPEGAVQTAHAVRDFDRYGMPVGPFGPDSRAIRAVEGAVAWSAWRLDDPQASVAAVMQGYRERLDALGFETVFSCTAEDCGGFDFRFGAEILPPPGMLVDVRDFAQLTAERDEPEGFVSVLVSRVLDEIYVQTVSVAPPGAAPGAESGAPALAPVEVTEVPLVETAPETVILPQDERALLARLMEEGHVPVKGLDFEVGGAVLSEASADALDMLARMLTRDQDLAVAIVGHSDNQGGLTLNLDLSQRRAEAVMQALVDRGVPPAQLEARGLGYLAPVASNRTEEGRALNRRVELVLR